jgi:AraC-like DNA-binding protein
MEKNSIHKQKIDPSEGRQALPEFQIKLHCCRYWLLEEWECLNMAFPFWRLYYNTFGNASVHFKGNSQVLTSEKVILIPPNTAFSTRLKNRSAHLVKESILGKQIESFDELKHVDSGQKADHLFIHFNLGLEPDHVKAGLYQFPINTCLEENILDIKQGLIKNGHQINLALSLSIHNLIFSFLKNLPSDAWYQRSIDRRVLKSLNFIDNHIDRRITNSELASRANMVTNSFARLFHENMNETLQVYVRKKKIERSCHIMHHTSESIDSIASNCGFVDRQHFSKVFRQVMNITPALYKKRHTMDLVEI